MWTKCILLVLLFSALTVVAFSPSVEAVPIPIPGLFNTGQGLAEGAADPNYLLTVCPVGFSGACSSVVTVTDGFPIPPYFANAASDKWIQPLGDGPAGLDDNHVAGVYTYTATFSLAGLDPTTAVLHLSLAADNSVIAFLNGNPIGSAVGFGAYTAQPDVTNDAFFSAGLNTLTFDVTNDPFTGANPSGLRALLSGEAEQVPEPSTLVLLGSGGLWFLFRARRGRPEA